MLVLYQYFSICKFYISTALVKIVSDTFTFTLQTPKKENSAYASSE